MKQPQINRDPFFNCFESSIAGIAIPDNFALMQNRNVNPLCVLAAQELQQYLINQKEWQHNFGLTENVDGMVIGKMFGVLVVKDQNNEIGYLAAFSGKLAGGNQHTKFVPPVFDTLAEDGFLNKGMEELTKINKAIKNITVQDPNANNVEIEILKTKRKAHSVALQNQIFNQYHFLNQAGEEKSLREIFKKDNGKNPPVGAGECAGPKLLQYAFQHQMRPIAITEFWWGLSPKSATWKHKEFYPCCKEKCEPILSHMLAGM